MYWINLACYLIQGGNYFDQPFIKFDTLCQNSLGTGKSKQNKAGRQSSLGKMPLRTDKNFREIQEIIFLKNKKSEAPKEVKDEVLGVRKKSQSSDSMESDQTILSQARHITRMGRLDRGVRHIIKAMPVDEEDLSTKLILER